MLLRQKKVIGNPNKEQFQSAISMPELWTQAGVGWFNLCNIRKIAGFLRSLFSCFFLFFFLTFSCFPVCLFFVSFSLFGLSFQTFHKISMNHFISYFTVCFERILHELYLIRSKVVVLEGCIRITLGQIFTVLLKSCVSASLLGQDLKLLYCLKRLYVYLFHQLF